MENKYYVTTFYQFRNLGELAPLKNKLVEEAKLKNIEGFVILGSEGINATVSALSPSSLSEWKKFIEGMGFSIKSKDSESDVRPFQRFVVKIREEIVTLGEPQLAPKSPRNHHLSTAEWNAVIKNEKCTLIDTRNWYETKLGTFKNSIVPTIEDFSDFPKFVDHLAAENKISASEKILIFCTGGIRCEKAILDMQEKGYENVYQLDGGILKYLEESPNDLFEGECFVFDHRVALDQNLKPSKKYGLCPHCGQPAEDLVTCSRCDSSVQICGECQKLPIKKETCSKNCAYHYELHPGRKYPAFRSTNSQHLR